MPENSQGLHEAPEQVSPATVDRHRAIASLMEELEAVDWYQQRVDATGDDDLRAILAHNRDEEKEHAAMVLEWLRRHDETIDRHLRTYLFTTASITEVESEEAGGKVGPAAADGSLGIGALRGGSL
ncbi:MAG TPA: ferritin-like domain-containing protein [Acidimicrobiales bacterium]|nr:ferritin-like domain-containing protein [Acidimicrobiales bacterium]